MEERLPKPCFFCGRQMRSLAGGRYCRDRLSTERSSPGRLAEQLGSVPMPKHHPFQGQRQHRRAARSRQRSGRSVPGPKAPKGKRPQTPMSKRPQAEKREVHNTLRPTEKRANAHREGDPQGDPNDMPRRGHPKEGRRPRSGRKSPGKTGRSSPNRASGRKPAWK